MKIEALIVLVALVAACEAPEADPPAAPDPIGDELLSYSTAIGVPGCVEGHLYRARDQVQFQCHASDGTFSWENRGALSPEGQATLDSALAGADLDNEVVVDEQGLCEGSEANAASMTLWIGDTSVSYSPGCPGEGVLALHDVGTELLGDISDCVDLDVLSSVEPECRAY